MQADDRPKHNLAIASNLLDQGFAVSDPNQVWFADITDAEETA